MIGRGKRASSDYIKERVRRKLQEWEGKLHSQARREVLIKSIIQVIPTYVMGYFKLPEGLCHEIEAMVKIILVETTWREKKDTLDPVGGVNKIQGNWWNGFHRLKSCSMMLY